MFTFEWNEIKAKINIKKHGVTFDEGSPVLYDDYARIIDDPDHSGREARFIILGLSVDKKLLVVFYCYEENEKVIRIFSVRKATRKESKRYWSFYEKRI